MYLMETQAKEAFIRRKRRQCLPTTTSNTAICSPFFKQVFLHDWWLTKADIDSYGKRLGIGGFTSKERQGIRSFSSGPIVKRHDAVTLRTVDGVMVLVHGHLNRPRTLENGFSHEVCEHFKIGFPYYWEEFAALSVGEEPAQYSFSDPYKTSSSGDHGTNMPSVNIFDEILRKNYADVSAMKEDTPMTTPEQKIRGVGVIEGVERTGPLTRSRARLLQTRRGSKSVDQLNKC